MSHRNLTRRNLEKLADLSARNFRVFFAKQVEHVSLKFRMGVAADAAGKIAQRECKFRSVELHCAGHAEIRAPKAKSLQRNPTGTRRG
jgi:hypothetical protein